MPKKQFSTGKDVSGHPLLLVISHVKEWIVKYGIDFGAVLSSKADGVSNICRLRYVTKLGLLILSRTGNY